MQHLYLSSASAILAERWLRRQPERSVRVLAEPGAQALPELSAVADTLSLAAEHEIRRSLAEDPQVVLPLATTTLPLRYRFPVTQPEMAPLYPLMRRLHGLGAREFLLHQPSGDRWLRLPFLLDDFTGRHAGQRCFVVGNGPSLNQLDMARLRGEITLGANRCFLGYPDWGFAFTYWGVYDPLQIEEYAAEYEAGVPEETVKFFPFHYLPWMQVENACPVNIQWPRAAYRQFSDAPDQVYRGYSVLYMLLQVAAVMGCNPIILIGLDHRYPMHKRYLLTRLARHGGRWLTQRYEDTAWYQAGRAAADQWFLARRKAQPPAYRIWEADDAQGPTHFTAQYTAERKKFLLPRPQDAEADYRCARQWAEDKGVQVLNATPGTALDVFEKVPFEALF